jgi:hypothetical protein
MRFEGYARNADKVSLGGNDEARSSEALEAEQPLLLDSLF